MITLDMHLIPFGSRFNGEDLLIQATFWTETDYSHAFTIRDNNGELLADGSIVKDRSGHMNPLHLLKAALDTVDLDKLGLDYVRTRHDRPK